MIRRLVALFRRGRTTDPTTAMPALDRFANYPPGTRFTYDVDLDAFVPVSDEWKAWRTKRTATAVLTPDHNSLPDNQPEDWK